MAHIKAKKTLGKFYRFSCKFGFDPRQTLSFFTQLRHYRHDLKKLKEQKGENTDFAFGTPNPIYQGLSTNAGVLSGHYFHQDLLIAQRIYHNQPKKHVDIGSRIDGFVAHVATFRPIEIFDIRPQESKVPNITFKQADLMKLPDGLEDYTDSISALHALEHFGLGRYGDPIDYYGHLKALENIYRMLKPGGTFYFSGPMGPQRIEFNAHRVFSLAYLLNYFKDKYTVQRFSYVDDAGDLHDNVTLTLERVNDNFGCTFGCFIFELEKAASQ